MKPIEHMDYHPLTERIVETLKVSTGYENSHFFRLTAAYYLGQMASMMRAEVQNTNGEYFPVNIYAWNLAPSGTGKSRSANIIEKQVMGGFRTRFTESLMPMVAEQRLHKMAVRRSYRNGTEVDEELDKLRAEYNDCGDLLFSFDRGTGPAIKQQRHKMMLLELGSLSLQTDEIGNNFTNITELLDAFLDLYDAGVMKYTLNKNTKENKRYEEIQGYTPANALLFGVASALLDGDKNEALFQRYMETGYGRRSLFGFSTQKKVMPELTPEEIYEMRMAKGNSNTLEDISDQFERLADMINVRRQIPLPRDVALELIRYEQLCSKRANELPAHAELERQEMNNRHIKALKLAGAYAFADNAPSVTEDLLHNAIKLVEDSGECFVRMLYQPKPYQRLAQYIVDCQTKLTQADLVEKLPFYKGGQGQRGEMMNLAIAYGYQNHMIIRKSYQDGIEFVEGEKLQETNLKEMMVSWSDDIAYGYTNELAPWSSIETLTQQKDLHWINHHSANGHRSDEDMLPGFNMIVLDVEKSVTVEAACELLKDYAFHLYTTKRHTPDEHRFRILIPTTHVLKLSADDYKQFMQNVFQWLPFEVDAQTGQRARKWLTCPGQVVNNEGKLLDVMPFIPRTMKNEQFLQRINQYGSLDNLERWFAMNTGTGNRNNQLFRYAALLVDSGCDLSTVQQKVIELNQKIPEPLTDQELMNTVFASVRKHWLKKNPQP